MARVFGLIAGVLLGLVAWGVAVGADEANPVPESVAYGVCQASADADNKYFAGQGSSVRASCAVVASAIAPGQCPGYEYQNWKPSGSMYQEKFSDGRPSSGGAAWCVYKGCQVGTASDLMGGAASMSRSTAFSPMKADGAGCCVSFSVTRTASYGGTTWQDGAYRRSGGTCSNGFGGNLTPGQGDKVDKVCDSGKSSCYDPRSKTACYTTQSGEQICKSMLAGDPGGCATGATGSVCVGKDGDVQPTPSDPPVKKGQPPDSAVKGSDTPNGGTTNNYTQNNYSGTSDGGSGGESGPPGSSSGGGSQSNNNGSGNTGEKGTGQDGKCENGSVPTASGCSGTFTDTGCDTPPQCFGDAVLCGSGKELWAIKCNTMPANASSSGGDGKLPDGVPADGGASGDPDAGSLWAEDGAGEGPDAGGLGWSRSCPANPHFSFMEKDYEIDVSPFCEMGGKLSWFIVLLASVVAARIVTGGT